MHINLLKEFKRKRNLLPKNLGKIIEIGSMDVNGSLKNELKADEYDSYLGTDMREGRGVDVVINGHDLADRFEPESFDTVVCMNTLEHDNKFWLTVEAMNKIIKKGGYVIFAVPTFFFPEHDYPDDFWRMSDSAIRNVIFEGYNVLHSRKVYVSIGGRIKCESCFQGIYNHIIYAIAQKK